MRTIVVVAALVLAAAGLTTVDVARPRISTADSASCTGGLITLPSLAGRTWHLFGNSLSAEPQGNGYQLTAQVENLLNPVQSNGTATVEVKTAGFFGLFQRVVKMDTVVRALNGITYYGWISRSALGLRKPGDSARFFVRFPWPVGESSAT